MPVVVTTEWLREFVDTDLPAEEIAERLSDVGLAVDAFDEIDGGPGGPGEVRLELELPTNRGDCWSVLGVARELASTAGLKLKVPAFKLKTSGAPVSKGVRVSVEDKDLCPRYTARLVRGVEIGPSPEWMQRRLEAVGIRPISNVVDITNYVLVETGQPLHAFDVDLLAGGRIVVRRAREGEEMRLIDGTAKTLTSEDLVIADAERPVALAGVMGGAGTEIRPTTRDVLLESAQFNQISTRRTAKRHGVSTESSIRFEHGVDPVGVELASRRAAYLLAEHAGGKVAPGLTDTNPKAWKPRTIRLRHSRVSRLLCGDTAVILDRDIVRILKSLGLEEVQPKKGRKKSKKGAAKAAETVTVWRTPSWRQDLTVEVDLIEEVARVYGYNRLPGRPTMRVFPVRPHPVFEARRKVRDVLTGLGYTEVRGASFFSPDRAFSQGGEGYRIRNPVRPEENALRTSLVPSLLTAKRAHEDHVLSDMEAAAGGAELKGEGFSSLCVRLFEVAPICSLSSQDAAERLAILDDGLREDWAEGAQARDDRVFLRLKGALERVAEALGTEAHLEFRSREDDSPMHCSIHLEGEGIGVAGRLDGGPGSSTWGLKTRPLCLEVDLRALTVPGGRTVVAEELPRYPSIARDVSLVLSESVTWARIEQAANQLEHELRSAPTFLSVYRGKQTGPGRKSVAFRVIYRARGRTLTNEEIKEPHEGFVSELCAALGAEIRK